MMARLSPEQRARFEASKARRAANPGESQPRWRERFVDMFGYDPDDLDGFVYVERVSPTAVRV